MGWSMPLIENTLFGKIDRVEQAIKRLQAFEPEEGYWLSFSGSKDSIVIKRLAELAGVKFQTHYSVTSVDPPELIRFVKAFNDVQMDIPKYNDGSPVTMWNLIVKKGMPPTRQIRYCCQSLKESQGKGWLTVTGVRWAESINRKNNHGLITELKGKKGNGLILNLDNDESRRMVESCYRTSKTLLNPIIDWPTDCVWEFIHTEKLPYCELYDKGFHRLGCIGCPLNSKQEQELEQYPKYKQSYIKAFARMLEKNKKEGKFDPNSIWQTADDVYLWWIGKLRRKDSDQIELKFM